jgi:XTP/dITP diphosphohydrolase
MRLSNVIVLATQNRDKLEEFRALLASEHPGVELRMASEFLRNPEGLSFAERHETYLDNALAKARLVNQGSHYPSLADDSGLEVEGLGGKPGVRSHRYATPRAGVSQDQANVELLLKSLGSGSSRDARFVCTLALLIEGIMLTSTGILEGTIADAPRGRNGFGYDPIFIPKGSNKTFAEMTSVEKNAASHRARALHDLMAQVKSHGIVLAKP